MMVMGYFRSTRSATTSSSSAPAAKKKKAKTGSSHEEAGLREALLDQPPAAAEEGGVPKGYFAVYVGEESRRFVVPTGYLREPAFRDLMERAADEFGFAQAGGLRVPCAGRTLRTSCAASSARTAAAVAPGGARRPSPGRRGDLARFLLVHFASIRVDQVTLVVQIASKQPHAFACVA